MSLIRSLLASLALLPALALAQERIISIGGDVSEIIYALKAEKDLVGRDSTTLLPKAKHLPDVGYMRQLNVEGILSLKPTKVISSVVAQPSVVLEQVKATGVMVEMIPTGHTPEAAVAKITQVGQALNQPQAAQALADDFQKRLAQVPNSLLKTKVLFMMSRAANNVMVAGQNTVADEIIRQVGATNAVQGMVRYSPISQEGIIQANPDLIIVTSESLKTLGSIDKLWEVAGLSHTKAGKNKAYVVVDDVAFMTFGLGIPEEMLKIRQAAERAAP
ncbi:hemin ABC transporter substrate-binding protein [Pasteurellaceae bacterium RH1A]|nr:hemin ABC transporter substrate-binding protein [Pasteurellaceae bacterium RH1A]